MNCRPPFAAQPSESSGNAPRAKWLTLAMLAVCVLPISLAVGCAGYRVGSASLYPPNIQTVYVPIFESDSFRRGLGERLTEAVIKEIELKTPYKVVGTPQADSVLYGRIVNDTKRVIVENWYDLPRESEINLVVQVGWVDRKGDVLSNQAAIPLPPAMVEIGQTGMLVPEYGQSVATSYQTAIQRMAERIVAMMESPW